MSSPNRSSSRSKNNPDPADELRRRSRRRLVGAILMFLAAVLVIPALIETEPKDTPTELELVLPEKPSSPTDTAESASKKTQPENKATPAQQHDVMAETPDAEAPFAGVPPLVGDEPSQDNVIEIPPLPMPTAKPELKNETKAESKADNKLENKPKTEVAKKEATPKETSKPSAAKPPEKTPPKPDPKPESKANLPTDDIERLAQSASQVANEPWYVQIAAVRDKTRAESLQATLKSKGFSAANVQTVQSADGPIYRVRVGPVKGQDAAESLKAKLAGVGHSGRITP